MTSAHHPPGEPHLHIQALPTSEQRGIPRKPAPRLLAEPRSRLQQLGDLGWLLASMVRMAPRPSLLWSLVALAQGLLVPLQLWLTKLLVDALAAHVAGSGGDDLFVWLGLLVAALLAGRALDGLQPWLQATVREQVGTSIQSQVMSKAAALDLASFEEQRYYDQLSQVLTGADERGDKLLQQTQRLLQAIPQVLGYAVALITLTPVLLLIVVVATVPTVIGWVVSGQINWSITSHQTRERRLADYYASLLTERPVAKEVRLYGLAGYLLDRWTALYWQTCTERRRLVLRLNLRNRATNVVSTGIVMLGLFWSITTQLIQTSAGGYALLLQAITGLTGGIFTLGSTLQALGEQSGYAAVFRAFLQQPDENTQSPQTLHPFPRPLQHGIRFAEVWFTYPGSDRPALSGVSLEMHAGETVALVGENGAGKSTLIKLLLGLYQPDAGRITIDGRDIRELDPRSLRAAVAAVFQQFVRYQLTLGENVGIGYLQQMDDRPRLEEALANAGVREIVQTLPDGATTLLGPDVGGVDLSGGQWQRVAIARAFFRNAELLVLDEPTAALDPLAALAVFERFVDLVQGRTAVLISHRLGMARLADRVIVLANGRVVEAGTHADLIRAGGEYATLFEAQAQWYR